MKKNWRDYFYVLIQALLFGAFFIPLPWDYPLPLAGHSLVSSFFIGMGAIIILLGFMHLRTNLTPFPTPKEQSHLVTSGIFSQVRHPIYTGLFLIFAGMALRYESLYKLLVAVLILGVFYFKSRYEEKKLRQKFPQYEKYKARTGRFVPKLGRVTHKGI